MSDKAKYLMVGNVIRTHEGEYVGELIAHDSELLRQMLVSANGSELSAKDARISELERLLRYVRESAIYDSTVQAERIDDALSGKQSKPKGCTKPGCFPYCDCSGVDEYVPDAHQDRPEKRGKSLAEFVDECEQRDPEAMAEAREWVKTVTPMAATPSEDGKEVPEVVAEVVVDKLGWSLNIVNSDIIGPGAKLMNVAQYLRIVAAKDAEIARLREAHDDMCQKAAFHAEREDALRAKLTEKDAEIALLRGPEQTVTSPRGDKLFTFMSKDPCRYRLCEVTYADPVRKLIEERDNYAKSLGNLRAQPARQVGGDDREAYVEWLAGTFPAVFSEADAIHHWQHDHVSALAWQARAALAPAAVVMPERQPFGSFRKTWNNALDEVARLNRRAIPVELLKRACKDYTGRENWDALEPDRLAAAAELRALLGKDGE